MIFFPFFAFTQQIKKNVISSSGAQLASNNLVMSFTVGEAFIGSLSSGNYTFIQGFQSNDPLQDTDPPIIKSTSIYNQDYTNSILLKFNEIFSLQKSGLSLLNQFEITPS